MTDSGILYVVHVDRTMSPLRFSIRNAEMRSSLLLGDSLNRLSGLRDSRNRAGAAKLAAEIAPAPRLSTKMTSGSPLYSADAVERRSENEDEKRKPEKVRFSAKSQHHHQDRS